MRAVRDKSPAARPRYWAGGGGQTRQSEENRRCSKKPFFRRKMQNGTETVRPPTQRTGFKRPQSLCRLAYCSPFVHRVVGRTSL